MNQSRWLVATVLSVLMAAVALLAAARADGIVFTGYGGGATGDISFNQEAVSAVGINEQGQAQGSVLVYPNPVTDGQAQVMLDLPAANSVARVFNATGQQMLEQQWSGHNGLSIRTLDVHGLAKGIYLLRIDTDRSNTTAKLVID